MSANNLAFALKPEIFNNDLEKTWNVIYVSVNALTNPVKCDEMLQLVPDKW